MATILLVENEPTIRKMYLECFSKDGYHAIGAGNGAEGLSLAKSKKPDLIIADVIMPEMNGVELFEAIQKEDDELANIPFIFLSADGSDRELIKGINLGANGYLTKPVSFDLMSAVVNSHLGQDNRQAKLIRTKVRNLYKDFFHRKNLKEEEYEGVDKLLDLYNTIAASKSDASVGFDLVQDIKVNVRTLDDVQAASASLAKMCPDPENAIIGITELLINAVEHGNLNIGYELKTNLLMENRWHEEVQKRLDLPENKDKFVEVVATRLKNGVKFEVSDHGKGFDPDNYLNFQPSRAKDFHGRGIALANAVIFSDLKYNRSGNKATAIISQNNKLHTSQRALM